MKLEIEVITYERDRLDYFTNLMGKAQKRYKRLFKKYKDAPILSTETEMLNEAGRVAHFHGDVVEMLEKGYRKQSVGEWKWISDDDCICSACGKVFYSADNADAGTGLWNFCPSCGAKMKGGAE